MDKHAQQQRVADEAAQADVSRRSFLTAGAAGAVTVGLGVTEAQRKARCAGT
jgi:hypothetical protein